MLSSEPLNYVRDPSRLCDSSSEGGKTRETVKRRMKGFENERDEPQIFFFRKKEHWIYDYEHESERYR